MLILRIMRHLVLRRGAGNSQFDMRLFQALLVVGVGMPVNYCVLGMAVLACLLSFFRCSRLLSVRMVGDVMAVCSILAPDRGYVYLVWSGLPSVAVVGVLCFMQTICQCLVLHGDYTTPPIMLSYDPFSSSTNNNAAITKVLDSLY